jgi:ribosomal protein S18 acetylase RimI-like enzyme
MGGTNFTDADARRVLDALFATGKNGGAHQEEWTRNMEAQYEIRYVDRPDDAAWNAIGGGIDAHNTHRAGAPQGRRLCFVLYGPEETIAGGLIGETHWNWFYISLMWIDEALRGRGHGHRLLTLAEDEARQRGATHAYLDTFSFQAPGFYQQHGYRVYGELRDLGIHATSSRKTCRRGEAF